MKDEKILCKDCTRLYSTGADQCNIPINPNALNSEEYMKAVYGMRLPPGITEKDKESIDVIKKRQGNIQHSGWRDDHVFGHPSQLNIDNDCRFFKVKPVHWFKRIFGK
jgi:hypothetical protein